MLDHADKNIAGVDNVGKVAKRAQIIAPGDPVVAVGHHTINSQCHHRIRAGGKSTSEGVIHVGTRGPIKGIGSPLAAIGRPEKIWGARVLVKTSEEPTE